MAGQGVTELVVASHRIWALALIAHEMRDLDLGYAPPFSPPYDPILIAADEIQKKLPRSDIFKRGCGCPLRPQQDNCFEAELQV